MTLLLAIETTVGPFSVSLFKDGALVNSYYHKEPHCQAEQLIPSINDILSDNGYNYFAISVIAVSVGPGSFTGIRIGLAAAQGIALAVGCHIIGVGTLEAMATAAKTDAFMVALAAGRDQFYRQGFSYINGELTATTTPHLISSEDAMRAKDGDIIITNTHESYPILSAYRVGLRAVDKMAKGLDALNPSPIYIRDADAKIPAR